MQEVQFYKSDTGDDLVWQIKEYLVRNEGSMKIDKIDFRIVTRHDINYFFAIVTYERVRNGYKTRNKK